ncbi:MAG: adenylate kinase [Bacteroidales bacterium]|nr:adenylate kinase [Bacteroidales bacterium]
MLNVVIFGPPGSGKGTQSEKLIEKYNLVHLSTGDILRAEVKGATPLGLKVKGIMERGELVSDEIIIEILLDRVSKSKNAKGFIFDGFPRTIVQAEKLDQNLNNNKTPITLTVALDVPEDVLMKRLLHRAQQTGRTDDTEDVIKNRIEVYKKQTFPLLDYYKKQNKLSMIQGVGTIDEIFVKVSEKIDSLKK